MSLNQTVARMRAQRIITGDAWRRLRSNPVTRNRGVAAVERRKRRTLHKNERHPASFRDCAMCGTANH